jgi:hypothetical protein
MNHIVTIGTQASKERLVVEVEDHRFDECDPEKIVLLHGGTLVAERRHPTRVQSSLIYLHWRTNRSELLARSFAEVPQPGPIHKYVMAF